jgi:hypothetical protein
VLRQVLIAVGVLLCAATAAHGQSLLERMVMPGPLANAHAKLETSCANCHQAFSPEAQSALCLACHEDIATDRATRRYYHGRSTEALTSQCRRCHSEHQGREASIIFSTPELFDHTSTEFPLTGAHIGVACGRCHVPKAAFRAARSDCHACHASEDPHQGALGPKCETCHRTQRWSETTPWPHLLWPLVGAHKVAACHACHAGPRYVGLPKSCVGCHRQDDFHRNKLGPNCAKCHTPVAWTILRTGRQKP